MEQGKLAAKIPAKESATQKLRDTVSSTEGFIARAKRYTDITELTPELLRLFIRKIVVHEKSTPAGNLSVIPAGVFPRVVDTPVRGRPSGARL